MKKTFLFFIFFILFYNVSQVSATNSNKTDIYKFNWEYKIGDSPLDITDMPNWISDSPNSISWKNYTIPEGPIPNSTDTTAWVKTVLPNSKVKDPTIFFITYNQVFEIYLDGKIIYSFGDMNYLKKNLSPGSPWHMISLPESYQGKTLYIKLHALLKNNTGYLRRFDFGSKSNLLLTIFHEDLDTLILTSIFLFIGIFCILVRLLGNQKEIRTPFLFIGLSSILGGCWIFTQTNIKQLLIYNPIFWNYSSAISLFFLPVCLSLFIKNFMRKKFTSLINFAIAINLGYALLFLFLDFSHILSVSISLNYFHSILGIIIFTIIFITIVSLYNGSSMERVFGISFSLLCFSGIIDIIRWNTSITHNFKYVCQWGLLIFIITMVFTMVSHLAKTQYQLKVYSDEIKLKEEILEEKKTLLQEAIEYDRIKTEHFANISHELRTPLNIILGSLQLMNLYIENKTVNFQDDKFPKNIKVMRQNCYRLIRLVNNIIDISKIHSGYMEPVFEERDIVATIEDITLSVVEYIKAKNIELIFDTNVEEKIMCFDAEKIERVILNLLSNAVKFSKPGSSIMVEFYDYSETVSINIIDTGIGIPQENLQTIFERFIQVDKSLSRAQEGSGIGLSLVKSLIEMHKGVISVVSELGKGSTFTITLPSNLTSSKKAEGEKINIPPSKVEKVSIEFSDIYN